MEPDPTTPPPRARSTRRGRPRQQQGPDPGADRIQVRARALGDPSRHAIYEHIARADHPVAIRDLVELIALNHTTIRQHLSKLREAGLIRETVAPSRGPGRPRLQYRITDDAAEHWNQDGPYQRLAIMLLGLAGKRRSPYAVGVAFGRRSATAAAPDAQPYDALQQVIAAQGFAPRRARGRRNRDLVLDRCPFAAAAEHAPDTVCELHRGLAQGLAEEIGGDIEVTGLTRRPPLDAGCVLHITARHPDGSTHR